MGRLIDTSDLNNKMMLSKHIFGMLSVPICNVFDDIIRDTPTVDAIVLPDNPTNGNMFLFLFTGSKVVGEDRINNTVVVLMTDDCGLYFNKDWWNAPYKENEDGSNSN